LPRFYDKISLHLAWRLLPQRSKRRPPAMLLQTHSCMHPQKILINLFTTNVMSSCHILFKEE
jgi:hypothetical protein